MKKKFYGNILLLWKFSKKHNKAIYTLKLSILNINCIDIMIYSTQLLHFSMNIYFSSLFSEIKNLFLSFLFTIARIKFQMIVYSFSGLFVFTLSIITSRHLSEWTLLINLFVFTSLMFVSCAPSICFVFSNISVCNWFELPSRH